MLTINPGTEPVDTTSAEQANANMGAFCTDLAAGSGIPLDQIHSTRNPEGDRDGRYGFRLTGPGIDRDILMPGCDLDTVQSGRPWHSPRLYVDGSSWLWRYALRICDPGED